MVKPGYKQSEVGIIPEDWGVTTLRAAFPKLEAGVSVNSDNMTSSQFHVLKTSAVHNGIFDPAEIKPVIKADYSRLKCPLVQGSIIISRMNTPTLVGECGYVKNAPADVYLPDRLWQIQNPKDSAYNFEWLNYLLNTKQYRDAVRATATGTSNSMKNISKERLMEVEIPWLSLDEQNRISVALSDIDALIANLEKLITTKKAIKQGTMQELLSGSHRLEGFNTPWKSYRVGNIGIFYSGLTGKSKADFGTGSARYITFMNVLANSIIDIRKLESVRVLDGESQNAVEKYDLFFNTSSETPEEVGMCAVLTEDLEDTYLNSFCFGFRVTEPEMHPLFLSYYFNSQEGRKIMGVLAQGATRYNLSKSFFSDTVITVPEKCEQIAIATILSDMEDEIDQLHTKLDKCKYIKSGMMSELLTGRIRLL